METYGTIIDCERDGHRVFVGMLDFVNLIEADRALCMACGKKWPIVTVRSQLL